MKYHQAFAIEEDERGRTNVMTCEIDTGNNAPTFARNYKIPFHYQEKVREQIQSLLDAGEIEPCEPSPYNSPILLVKKKDGSARVVSDFRMLIMSITADHHPLPNIQEILDLLGQDGRLDSSYPTQKGNTYFTVLDMIQGYQQVPLSKKSQLKTAFSVGDQCYCYLGMPMGIKTASSVFSRLMQKIFLDLIASGILVYIDDISILLLS
jgi:hypothetical protein